MMLRKVSAGDPLSIPADAYNSFVDAARAHRGGVAMDAGQPGARAVQPATIKIKNTSGADLDMFSVVGVDGILFGPADNLDQFKREPVLTAVTPTTDHAGAFAVLLQPVAAGKFGVACVDGVVQVRVNVTDEAHDRADVLDGDATKLGSSADGSARIIWKEAGTGDRWAVVRLADPSATSSLRFAHVTTIHQSNGDAWTNYVTDGQYPRYATAAPANARGEPITTADPVLIGLNSNVQSPNGIITEVDQLIAYIPATTYSNAMAAGGGGGIPGGTPDPGDEFHGQAVLGHGCWLDEVRLID